MARTLVQTLADFTVDSTYDRLPAEVVEECKRLVLDSIGCALAATEELKGRAGIDYGRLIGGSNGPATIMGTGDKVSVLGAAFANGELINTLDMDSVIPPGHITPYVLPAALAQAEADSRSGKTLISALASSHEMSMRLGRAMDNQRDIVGGKLHKLKVFGYASTIFGATAAVGQVKGYARDVMANALGIAGCISPVNSQIAWFEHAPSSTIKYLMAGMLAQQALTAAHMAEFGHRGDIQVLDDRDTGYARFIGTLKWEPEHLTKRLGEEWLFPAFTSYKVYPHCRIMAAMMDCAIDIVQREQLKPDDIEHMLVFVEGIGIRPCWTNRVIDLPPDAQFSMAHGMSVAAHLIPPGKAWMDPALLHSPSVMSLMKRITTEVHPDYVKLLESNAASRPARVEIKARGKTFVGEKRYPKGSPSPEPDSRMSNDELIAKFKHNADGVISTSAADRMVELVFGLEKVADVGAFMKLAGSPPKKKMKSVA